MIHTTIGVYPDGSYKTNGVSTDNLHDHIHYNMKYRPGRALILDGKCIYIGNVKADIIDNIIAISNTLIQDNDTKPYH